MVYLQEINNSMISVAEAQKIIQDNVILSGEETYLTTQSKGRILAENIKADRPLPPFDRVMMDGIALSFEAWKSGIRRFEIVATQFAGEVAQTSKKPTDAIEIMTGAICPDTADVIVPYEEFKIEEENAQRWAVLSDDLSIQAFQNLHRLGSDHLAGETLLETGIEIGVPEIAIAVSVGKSEVLVKKTPKIALISTGNELVEINETPLPFQIRKSNVYALEVALPQTSTQVSSFHLPDNRKVIYDTLEKILAEFDLVVLSGGVSKGKADYVPEVLAELGVEKLFHTVKQRPGKPFWFGRTAKTAVFALPGNPVSTVAGFYRYVKPYLYAMQGLKTVPSQYAKLAQDYVFEPTLTLLLTVQATHNTKGELIAQPFAGKGSGDYANLRQGNGFLELPEERTHFKAGEAFPFWSYR